MEGFRRQIDDIDETIVDLLAQRLEICRWVGVHKRSHGIPMMQGARVEQVLARVAAMAIERNLDPDLLRQIYVLIIAGACRLEDEIIGS